MGMFDNLRCEYELPGDVPLDTKSFDYQTKNFDCKLWQYTVTKDGQLFEKQWGGTSKPKNFTGDVNFYHSNVVASGPGVYTRDGEDSFWLEYQAIFIDGKLTHIRLIHYESSPAQKSSLMWKNQPTFASQEERTKWWKKERQAFEDWVKAELKRREGE